jgi:hypothetical protein
MDVIRRTRLVIIVLSVWVVAFFGALLCITPDKLKEGQAFAFLALAPVGESDAGQWLVSDTDLGVLQDYVLVFAQFACRPQELGVVICKDVLTRPPGLSSLQASCTSFRPFLHPSSHPSS